MANIAVIGCGYWGKNLVRSFAELGVLKLVCDTDKQRLVGLECSVAPDYHIALVDGSIEGVVIATPAVTHFTIARECLLADKDVMVEKPMALSVEEGLELVRVARDQKRVLLVGHLLEYHPAIMELHNIIESGRLGDIRYIYSTRLNLGKFRGEENVLWSFAPHDIAVILMLVGMTPFSVSTQGGAYLRKSVSDVTFTTLSFSDGVKAQVFVSWLHPYREQKLVVVGSDGMAVFEDWRPGGRLSLYDKTVDWIDGQPIPNPSQPINIPVRQDEPLNLECLDFVECIEQRRKPRVDLERALNTLRVLSACQESLSAGGLPIEVR